MNENPEDKNPHLDTCIQLHQPPSQVVEPTPANTSSVHKSGTTPSRARQAGATIGRISRSVVLELRAIVASTGAQIVRMIAYGLAYWRLWGTRRKLVHSQIALGKWMFHSGAGDEGLRRKIAEIDDRIQSLEAAKGSTKALNKERSGLWIRLAAVDLSQETAMAKEGLAATAKALQDEVKSRDVSIAVLRSQMAPSTCRERLRVVSGFVSVALLLVVFLWRPSHVPQPTPTPDVENRSGTPRPALADGTRDSDVAVSKGIPEQTMKNPTQGPLTWDDVRRNADNVCSEVLGKNAEVMKFGDVEVFGIGRVFTVSYKKVARSHWVTIVFALSDEGKRAADRFCNSSVFTPFERRTIADLTRSIGNEKKAKLDRFLVMCKRIDDKGMLDILWDEPVALKSSDIHDTMNAGEKKSGDVFPIPWEDIERAIGKGNMTETGKREDQLYALVSQQLLVVARDNTMDMLFPATDDGFRYFEGMLQTLAFTAEEQTGLRELVNSEIGKSQDVGRFRAHLRPSRKSSWDALPDKWIRIDLELVDAVSPQHALWDGGQGTLSDMLDDPKYGVINRAMLKHLGNTYSRQKAEEVIRQVNIAADRAVVSRSDLARLLLDSATGIEQKGLEPELAVQVLKESLFEAAAIQAVAYDHWSSRTKRGSGK